MRPDVCRVLAVFQTGTVSTTHYHQISQILHMFEPDRSPLASDSEIPKVDYTVLRECWPYVLCLVLLVVLHFIAI